MTVRGIVIDARYALDGDAILYLRLDPEYAHLSNQKNYEELGKDMLELEIVCRHPIFRFFVFRCWKCGSKMWVPRAGDHIEADGTYVQDKRHRHMELHPSRESSCCRTRWRTRSSGPSEARAPCRNDARLLFRLEQPRLEHLIAREVLDPQVVLRGGEERVGRRQADDLGADDRDAVALGLGAHALEDAVERRLLDSSSC